MAAEIIYGKELAESIRARLKDEVAELHSQQIHPKLAVVILGNDPASQSYVKGKKKASANIGMDAELIELSEETTQAELLDVVDRLNQDTDIHGILVQLPLPDHINEDVIIEAISPEKDVDGFHPISIGRMMAGKETFLPCTPLGIMTMFHEKGISIRGKHAVVVGRSRIVGKPVGQLLLNEHATVTYCHSRTENMDKYIQEADILIVAVGKPGFVHGDQIKDGAVVIDVGVNRIEDGTLTGDVDFESAKEKASYITPVPRGVGPMTITMLLQNTIQAAKQIHHATTQGSPS
ncbi:bifunctional 5,10-methylene-tetrahydrofolate dehydrogenase/ 5,10-methylene-tetrahydrofolate cyclohydrolase [Pontibacillus halophilus JSM 076056 = DSM 19796]|uniref:Bifunctional protein FolD n=1 Tax=Pontibacillus halophilus JSM 076056 = DSM 19796 TaxID=1385510 RepID=A0A0A5GCJ7_9BACI|nr:bifunctional methylenetetrahydrofolate dehydrogenase/methenyltetrahydrofolate cyclohydrolase FolD [Pontibacillus halophilus]KGX90911.1 bifunctional 5,10-methylene-tetrahydrofolate dehydrogenase/ 5,10-methylene-tetrahydrofolate cyclohydrolase [Pontibacillus halophilus JSM 076056 = DSM 19796]